MASEGSLEEMCRRENEFLRQAPSGVETEISSSRELVGALGERIRETTGRKGREMEAAGRDMTKLEDSVKGTEAYRVFESAWTARGTFVQRVCELEKREVAALASRLARGDMSPAPEFPVRGSSGGAARPARFESGGNGQPEDQPTRPGASGGGSPDGQPTRSESGGSGSPGGPPARSDPRGDGAPDGPPVVSEPRSTGGPEPGGGGAPAGAVPARGIAAWGCDSVPTWDDE